MFDDLSKRIGVRCPPFYDSGNGRGVAEGEAVSHYMRRYAAGGTFFLAVVTCDRCPPFVANA